MDANTTMDVPTLSMIEFQDYIENDIPVSIYLTILSVIGTVGNVHAVFVYFLRYKPSNHRTFVVWLAAIDFIACLFSIPFELFDIRFSCTFTIDGLCRFFRYLGHFVSMSSGSLLGVIAVERFRKACRPFDRQLEGRGAMIACIVTVVISAVISIPALVMYGSQVEIVDNYDINGTDCKVLDKFKDSLVFKGFNLLLLFISTAVFIACVVIYIFIGRVLYQQYKFRSSLQVKKSVSTVMDKSVSSDTLHTMQEEESSMANPVMSRTKIFGQNGDKPMKIKPKNPKRFDRSKQITLMFLVATGVSYLGYLPSLILTLIKAASKNSNNVIDSLLGPVGGIFLRGYFISNVTNPLVYCFLDDKFREECKAMYKILGMRISKCFHRPSSR